MIKLAEITLENEMDLTLAYKKSIQVTAHLKLTTATQTAFATAVSEVCREVIDKAFEGLATIGTTTDNGRIYICTHINCRIDENFIFPNPGFEYARKLIPSFELETNDLKCSMLLKMAVPGSTRIDNKKILEIKKKIEQEGPISSYEGVKQKNTELQQLNLQHELELVHAKYLNEQKNEFLSVASHELNSPLTVLRSLAQLALRMEDGSNGMLNDQLKKIEEQSAKLVSLTQQLFDISTIENGQFNYNREATDFESFLKAAVECARLLVPAHKVEMKLNATGTIAIDRIKMEQVLNNIVINAAKYSLPGSRIIISSFQEKDMVQVQVRDEGIGMSAETVKNIFKKFYRAEGISKKYSGLGMGLYIASKIVSDHQGILDVESVEGEGSVLSIKIPVINRLQAAS